MLKKKRKKKGGQHLEQKKGGASYRVLSTRTCVMTLPLAGTLIGQ